MDESSFWALIDGLPRGSLDRRIAVLERELTGSDPATITGFADQLAIHLRRLDTPQHAAAAGLGAGDSFLYSRCAVILAGHKRYTAVAASPRRMARFADDEAELLLTAAPRAYEEVTGMAWEHQPSVDSESGTGPLWGDAEPPPEPDLRLWLAVYSGSGAAARPSREYEVTMALLNPVLNAEPAWQQWWQATGVAELEAHLVFDPAMPQRVQIRRGRKLIRAEVVRPLPGFASPPGTPERERARADLRAVIEMVAAELSLTETPPFPPAPDLPPDM